MKEDYGRPFSITRIKWMMRARQKVISPEGKAVAVTPTQEEVSPEDNTRNKILDTYVLPERATLRTARRLGTISDNVFQDESFLPEIHASLVRWQEGQRTRLGGDSDSIKLEGISLGSLVWQQVPPGELHPQAEVFRDQRIDELTQKRKELINGSVNLRDRDRFA